MKERKNKRQREKWIFAEIAAIFALWLFLIVLKAVGYIDMHWALVLSGIVWISWLWFAYTALLVLIIHGAVKLKHWRRRRKIDRRIVRQAKAAGVWERPQCLGGRALEICAREQLRIRRRPGETDAELRRRCMEKVDQEYADSMAKVYDYETARIAKRGSKK